MMRRKALDRLLLALGLALSAASVALTPAFAHVRSESHSVWEINGRTIDLVMTIPKVESQRLNPNGPQIDDAGLEKYLAARVYPIASGVRCPIAPPIVALSSAPAFRRFDFTFTCPSTRDIEIRSSAFFDVVSSHTNFAQIQNVQTGDFVEELITQDRQTVQVTGGQESKLKNASIFEFIRMGVMHIFTGVDHMSFLLGMVMISRRLKDLIFVVTGFTIGHSITLALAVTGVLRPHADYIDALVALTICLIGAENLSVATEKPAVFALGLAAIILAMAVIKLMGFGGLPVALSIGAGLFTANYLMISGHLPDAGRLRMIITLVFGLIHGFGFAAGLLEMQIPPGRLAEMLVGFNIGVEIGQLTLVLGVTLLVYALSRIKWTVPRPVFVDFASAFLIAEGLFWYVSRSFV
ncbi:MAG TPA: HupE/UreJ family protein [Caulobacteraceae bacterium]|nr:HupE/UreJ family protein [Caulobacteraceae bacterium]